MSVDLLLEIGTEEIPDWMIPAALEHLKKQADELVKQIGSVRTDATPRRLVIRILGLDPEQSLTTVRARSEGERTGARGGRVCAKVGRDSGSIDTARHWRWRSVRLQASA